MERPTLVCDDAEIARLSLTLVTDPVPIMWDYDDPLPVVDWRLFEYEVVTNSMLGIEQIIWSDSPMTI